MSKRENKTGIVFGASGDIGSAFARSLSGEVNELFLVYRTLEPIVTLPKGIKVHKLKFDYPLNCDVLESVINKIEKPFDYVVNTIGLYRENLDKYSVSDFNMVLEQNFTVLQYLSKLLCGKLANGSHFINISSIASNLHSEREFAYSSAKYIIDRYLEILREDIGYRNCNILNIRPGAVIGRITRSRPNNDKLIDPYELAELCLKVVKYNKNMSISELNIFRNKRLTDLIGL
jgi:NADP-dependent 3-hydroxy acid dehydrogenase YdfG